MAKRRFPPRTMTERSYPASNRTEPRPKVSQIEHGTGHAIGEGMSNQAQQIATTTLSQFGGSRALAMIGGTAYHEPSGALTVNFKARNRGRWKGVKIALSADDTYEITFYRMARKAGILSVESKSFAGLYNDNLKSTFESTTGLYLSI